MATSLDWPEEAALAVVLCGPPGERRGAATPPLGLSLPARSALFSRLRPRFPEPGVLAALGLGLPFGARDRHNAA